MHVTCRDVVVQRSLIISYVILRMRTSFGHRYLDLECVCVCVCVCVSRLKYQPTPSQPSLSKQLKETSACKANSTQWPSPY